MEYALITGGTSGIGFELARCFAADGYGIIIVSGNEEKLMNAKLKLKQYQVPIKTILQDLSVEGAAKQIYQETKHHNYEVYALVNNAGVGTSGPIEQMDLAQNDAMLRLNVITVFDMMHLFLLDMYQKKRGIILNTASTGAFQPGPYTSSYYASKAFVLSLSEAIHYEAKKYGVKVIALCPGATRTDFFLRSGKSLPTVAMSPEKVAKTAYKKLKGKKSVIVPGFLNRLMQFAPKRIKILVVARYQMKLYKERVISY